MFAGVQNAPLKLKINQGTPEKVTAMCRIVGGVEGMISRGLYCKINTIKGRVIINGVG